MGWMILPNTSLRGTDYSAFENLSGDNTEAVTK